MTHADIDRSFRNRERVLGPVMYALLLLAFVDLAVQRPTWSNVVGLCAASIVGALLIWRFVTIRVTATPTGVTVRNFFKSYRLAWDRVARFRYGQYGLNPSIGVADLTDSRSVPLAALQGPPLFPNSKRTHSAREAVAYLEHRRANCVE